MTSSAMKVYGERITQAREARAMSKTTLADLLGVAAQTVSNYESNTQSVSFSRLLDLSRYLKQPVDFFGTEPLKEAQESGQHRFRSLRVTKQKMAQVAVRLTWLHELVRVIDRYIVLPSVDLPECPARFARLLKPSELEGLAENLRATWGLGNYPVDDLMYAAESHGIVIQRAMLQATAIDGVSKWARGLERPLVLLNSSKASKVRSRFDLAHEIGHLLAHRQIDEGFAIEVGPKVLEAEAHAIASAILLPKATWLPEAHKARTLGDFLSLKPKWQVSVKAMLYRARELGLLKAEAYIRLMKDYSRRGWHKGEPLDNVWKAEEPGMIKQAIEMLQKRGSHVRREVLSLDSAELTNLLGIEMESNRNNLPIDVRTASSDTGNVPN